MAINYAKIVSKIQKSRSVDRDTAWTALSTAFLQLDRSKSEAEQAAYLYQVGCAKVFTEQYTKAWSNEFPVSQLNDHSDCRLRSRDDDDKDTIEYFVAPQPVQTDNDFIIDIIANIPQQYRVGLSIVLHNLLQATKRRGTITPELIRQILKRAKVPCASDQAINIYTFLMTIKL